MPLGPTLPKELLDQVGGRPTKRTKGLNRQQTRKDERQQKKQARRPQVKSSRPPIRPHATKHEHEESTRKPVAVKIQPTKTRKENSKTTKSDEKPKLQPVLPTPSDPAKPIVSKTVRDALAADDAEISRLEKKLGVRGKKRKVVDDFDDLLGDLEDGSDDEDQAAQEWLQQKRRRVESVPAPALHNDASDHEAFNSDSESDLGSDAVSSHSDNWESGSELESEAPVQAKPRENPYLPPTDGPKYVPPSLRKATSEDKDLGQLRRQVQGQVNRLSESNMLSIVASIEQIYANNARQPVTSTLVDVIFGLVADESPLTDHFIVLHAGFVAAVFRTIGTDFGAHVVERLVADITFSSTKSSSNLLAFVSDLYSLDVIACPLMYDYIRLMTESLTENDTEILLRVIRHCGPRLRQDDPEALKSIVADVRKKVGKSVRSQYMLEAMSDLQANRSKPSTVTEYVLKMRKTLGTLQRRAEPLRISMADVRDSTKKGKWWLVGASWAQPDPSSNGPSSLSPSDLSMTKPSSSTADNNNLQALARSQGMNTDVRRAIFVTLMSATDYKDAHVRLLKLSLKPKQAIEIPRVLIHCAGAEDGMGYNHYYTLVAAQFVTSSRKMATTFQFCLSDFLARLDAGEVQVRESFNLARMYAFLLGRGLSVTVLKKLEFAYLSAKTITFLEMLLVTLLNAGHVEILAKAHDVPDMVAGLRYFIQDTVAKSDLLRRQEQVQIALELLAPRQ